MKNRIITSFLLTALIATACGVGTYAQDKQRVRRRVIKQDLDEMSAVRVKHRNQVCEAIKKVWPDHIKYPMVGFAFNVHRDGTVSNVCLIGFTGSTQLDGDLKSRVSKMSFHPLPENVPEYKYFITGYGLVHQSPVLTKSEALIDKHERLANQYQMQKQYNDAICEWKLVLKLNDRSNDKRSYHDTNTALRSLAEIYDSTGQFADEQRTFVDLLANGVLINSSYSQGNNVFLYAQFLKRMGKIPGNDVIYKRYFPTGKSMPVPVEGPVTRRPSKVFSMSDPAPGLENYRNIVYDTINDHWVPNEATGQMRITIDISRIGKVLNMKIDRGVGDINTEGEVAKILNNIQFAPFPDGWSIDHIRVDVYGRSLLAKYPTKQRASAGGQAQIRESAASPGASLSGDYVDKVLKLVSQRWKPTPETPDIRAALYLDRDGSILDTVILKSSHDHKLDEQVLNALKNKYSPLPETWKDYNMQIVVTTDRVLEAIK